MNQFGTFNNQFERLFFNTGQSNDQFIHHIYFTKIWQWHPKMYKATLQDWLCLNNCCMKCWKIMFLTNEDEVCLWYPKVNMWTLQDWNVGILCLCLIFLSERSILMAYDMTCVHAIMDILPLTDGGSWRCSKEPW